MRIKINKTMMRILTKLIDFFCVDKTQSLVDKYNGTKTYDACGYLVVNGIVDLQLDSVHLYSFAGLFGFSKIISKNVP